MILVLFYDGKWIEWMDQVGSCAAKLIPCRCLQICPVLPLIECQSVNERH